MMNDSMKSAIS
jgi:hypothetical protein